MIYSRSLQAELEQAAISPLPETISPKKQRVARIDHGQTTKGVESKGGDPKGTCPKGGDEGGKGGKPESTSNALRLKPRVKPRTRRGISERPGFGQSEATLYVLHVRLRLQAWTCMSVQS